jgi:hypothetical protein
MPPFPIPLPPPDGGHVIKGRRREMLRAADSQHDLAAVDLDVQPNAFWGGRGGHNVVEPARWHHNQPLSFDSMADADYVPNGYASGGASHSSVGMGAENQYRSRSTLLRELPSGGDVTYTAETSATPWGSVVDAPENDFIDAPVSRDFEYVGPGAHKLATTYAQPIPSVTGFGYADVPGRDGYEYRWKFSNVS